jgi:hypothetical protein
MDRRRFLLSAMAGMLVAALAAEPQQVEKIPWVGTSVGTASAECAALRLRTFTSAERAHLETQYGPNWWQALGLIPGPSTPADYVNRPFGDSFTTVYSPQQFWDPQRPRPGRQACSVP